MIGVGLVAVTVGASSGGVAGAIAARLMGRSCRRAPGHEADLDDHHEIEPSLVDDARIRLAGSSWAQAHDFPEAEEFIVDNLRLGLRIRQRLSQDRRSTR